MIDGIRIHFEGKNPLSFPDHEEVVVTEAPSVEEQEACDLMVKSLDAYVREAKKLLEGKYAHLREFAPRHFLEKGNILAIICTNGLVIRYERKTENPQIIVGGSSRTIEETTFNMSQKLVVFDDYPVSEEEKGLIITFGVSDSPHELGRPIHSLRLYHECQNTIPSELPRPPRKPFCLLSIQDSHELQIHGKVVPEGQSDCEGYDFIIRQKLEVSIGWACIEVFPGTDFSGWRPEFAATWAETDILASVLRSQARDQKFSSLDVNAGAREYYKGVLDKYRELLDSNPEREEELQVFLKNNPLLLCPSKTKMWPKLRIGERVTDFVFRDGSNNYLLIEIERSNLSLFNKNGDKSSALNHAFDQIIDWRRYIEHNLLTVRNEIGLDGITSNCIAYLVIGRSNSLSKSNVDKLATINSSHPTIRIMTYDDVYQNAKAMLENLLGPLDTMNIGTGAKIYYLSPRH